MKYVRWRCWAGSALFERDLDRDRDVGLAVAEFAMGLDEGDGDPQSA